MDRYNIKLINKSIVCVIQSRPKEGIRVLCNMIGIILGALMIHQFYINHQRWQKNILLLIAKRYTYKNPHGLVLVDLPLY
jgi:uncharacterized membrane protein YgaE (UPF0421/DUF939 family)